MNTNRWIIVFLVLGIAIGIATAIFNSKDKSRSQPSTNTSPLPTAENFEVTNKLNIEDQPAASVLTVKEIELIKPGYVVIYKSSDTDNTKGGPIIANSDILPAGKTINLKLTIYDNTDVEAGETIFAGVVVDDGNQKYGLEDIDLSNSQADLLPHSKFTLQ